jgi:sortase (surface protein transpeptidase)
VTLDERDISYSQVGPGGSGSHSPGVPGRTRRNRIFLLFAFLALLAVAALTGVFGASCGQVKAAAVTSSDTSVASVTTTLATLPPTSTTTLAATTTSTVSTTTTTTIYTHTIASPTRIVIPAIKCDAKVVSVGRDKRGAMQVPDVTRAGWYKLGPAPGASGPSVIVAHVSYNGTHGPFYGLKNLRPGDKIVVYDKSGDYATFQVDSKETVLKTSLPTERIWNDTSEPVIRLVTCGGKWDPTTNHYLSNVIVYGHLVR